MSASAALGVDRQRPGAEYRKHKETARDGKILLEEKHLHLIGEIEMRNGRGRKPRVRGRAVWR